MILGAIVGLACVMALWWAVRRGERKHQARQLALLQQKIARRESQEKAGGVNDPEP